MLNGPFTNFNEPTTWINYVLEIHFFHFHVHLDVYNVASGRTQDAQMLVVTRGKKTYFICYLVFFPTTKRTLRKNETKQHKPHSHGNRFSWMAAQPCGLMFFVVDNKDFSSMDFIRFGISLFENFRTEANKEKWRKNKDKFKMIRLWLEI